MGQPLVQPSWLPREHIRQLSQPRFSGVSTTVLVSVPTRSATQASSQGAVSTRSSVCVADDDMKTNSPTGHTAVKGGACTDTAH